MLTASNARGRAVYVPEPCTAWTLCVDAIRIVRSSRRLRRSIPRNSILAPILQTAGLNESSPAVAAAQMLSSRRRPYGAPQGCVECASVSESAADGRAHRDDRSRHSTGAASLKRTASAHGRHRRNAVEVRPCFDKRLFERNLRNGGSRKSPLHQKPDRTSVHVVPKPLAR
jgi:hypothetical protein